MPLYFAYGSNMDRAHMAKLCPLARAHGTGLIKHHRLFVAAGGYGSIAPRRNAAVHGVLWQVSAPDIAALDVYESVPSGLYRQAGLPVHFGQKLVRALVYLANDERPGRASPAYRRLVLDAARSWELPEDYLGTLEAALG